MAIPVDCAALVRLLQEHGSSRGLTIEQIIAEIESEIREEQAEATHEESPLSELELCLTEAHGALEDALECLEDTAELRLIFQHELAGIDIVRPEEIEALLGRLAAERDAIKKKRR